MSKWTRISKKKPPLTIVSSFGASSVMVLVADLNFKIMVAYYFKCSDDEEWYDHNGKVIHSRIDFWQYLPKLPPINFEK